MKRICIFLAAVLLAAGANAEDVQRTLEAAANGSVDVSNISGMVKITGWARNEVSVDAELGSDVEELVFKRDGEYWLSITYTTSAGGPAEYHDTILFRSTNPFDFGTYSGDESHIAARLYAHAPEYIVDPDNGQWYVTSCGWRGDAFGTVIPGSVAIRELDWV